MANVENQSLVGDSASSSVSAVVTKRIKIRFEQVLHGFQDGQLRFCRKLYAWRMGHRKSAQSFLADYAQRSQNKACDPWWSNFTIG